MVDMPNIRANSGADTPPSLLASISLIFSALSGLSSLYDKRMRSNSCLCSVCDLMISSSSVGGAVDTTLLSSAVLVDPRFLLEALPMAFCARCHKAPPLSTAAAALRLQPRHSRSTRLPIPLLMRPRSGEM